MKKKSFVLMITILLFFIFSLVLSSFLSTKSISNENLKNHYLYIQGKNHLSFLREYLNDIDLSGKSRVEIVDEKFIIYAKIDLIENIYKIELFVKSKNSNISLHETMKIAI